MTAEEYVRPLHELLTAVAQSTLDHWRMPHLGAFSRGSAAVTIGGPPSAGKDCVPRSVRRRSALWGPARKRRDGEGGARTSEAEPTCYGPTGTPKMSRCQRCLAFSQGYPAS